MSASPEVNSSQRSQREPVIGSAGATSVADPAPAGEQVWSPHRWLAFAVLIAAGFMDLLDTTIVNVAIPSIRTGLTATYAQLQWIVAGYLLALAVGLITGGRLGDMYGRKRVFLVGVVAFGLASLASGVAPTAGTLIGSRVLQGLAASIMIPQILSVVQVSFPREEQAKAVALYSSVAGVAVMSGPLLAGVLLDVFHWSWRSIFLINVPVSGGVVIAGIYLVPESHEPEARRLDPGGVVLVSAALFALVFGLIAGRQFGWPAWTFLLIAATAPLLVLFTWYERHYERAGGSPLVSTELLAQRAFSSGLAVVLVFFTGIVAFFLAFTIFVQLGLGWTPLESALTTFPSSIGLALASQVGGKLAPRYGTRLLAVGALIMACAVVGLILTVRADGSGLTAWDVRPVIFVFGVGMGLIVPTLADVVLSDVDARHAGAASGLINTGMQVGNAVGVAVIGVILFGSIAGLAPGSAARARPQLSRQLAAAGVPDAVGVRAAEQFTRCFVDRSKQEDPAASPASCRRDEASALPRPMRDHLFAALDAAGKEGRADDFVGAIQRALWYEVAALGLTVLLLLVLPFRPRGAAEVRI